MKHLALIRQSRDYAAALSNSVLMTDPDFVVKENTVPVPASFSPRVFPLTKKMVNLVPVFWFPRALFSPRTH